MLFDESYLLSNKDYKINDVITIHQPTLKEIIDYGEEKYFNLICNLTATPTDLKWQIYDYANLYWDSVDDFFVFIFFVLALFKVQNAFSKDDTKILFGNLDFSSLEFEVRDEDGERIVYQKIKHVYQNKKKFLWFNINVGEPIITEEKQIVFDSISYSIFTDYIRIMNGLKKNEEKAGNNETRSFMIDIAREDYQRNLDQKNGYKSILLPYLLFYCTEMKIDYNAALNMPIFVFMESINQIMRNKKVDQMISGIYFGTVDQKKINKKELNYFREEK